jgi:hypothetical protein
MRYVSLKDDFKGFESLTAEDLSLTKFSGF